MNAKHIRDVLGLALFLGLAGAVSGQDIRLLDCPQVAFFTEGCVPVAPPPVERPEPLPPLFPPETLAHDTPALMQELLADPTPANAQRFLEWHRERMARIGVVQRLLREQAQRPQGE